MSLDPNFREFLGLLDRHGVEFLVVGGYAVGFHGFPRYTGDPDVFVAVSTTTAAAMVEVFREFGFGELGLVEADFLEPDMVVEIGREPLKIQVLTGIDGVVFEEAFRRRVVHEEGGTRIPFIGFDDLLRNKAASPRAKDRIDREELLRLQRLRDPPEADDPTGRCPGP